ncbi:hypothetical protein V6N13_005933 [Hibiscus sabdariffa]
MLQIRLSKTLSSDAAVTANPSLVETVMVACPDHLVLADLPVAKCIGFATSSSLLKTVGRRSHRQLGEKVHFCVCCDFPIAIYGRLTEFESHIHESHADLLDPNVEKGDGKDLEIQSAKQPTGLDSTMRVPLRPAISPGSNPNLHDTKDKARWQQPREQLPPRPIMQPVFGQVPNYPSEPQSDTNHFQQGVDRQGTAQPESSQLSDKQRGHLSENQFSEYPHMYSMQPPNFVMLNSNRALTPYGVPLFPTNGYQPFYGAPYEMARPSSTLDAGSK